MTERFAQPPSTYRRAERAPIMTLFGSGMKATKRVSRRTEALSDVSVKRSCIVAGQYAVAKSRKIARSGTATILPTERPTRRGVRLIRGQRACRSSACEIVRPSCERRGDTSNRSQGADLSHQRPDLCQFAKKKGRRSALDVVAVAGISVGHAAMHVPAEMHAVRAARAAAVIRHAAASVIAVIAVATIVPDERNARSSWGDPGRSRGRRLSTGTGQRGHNG
jgi:hypothetical protein